MHEDIDSRRRFITNAVYLAVWIGIIFVIFRYLLNLIWPFFLAFIFSWILRPMIRFMNTRWHVKYSAAAAVCLIIFFAVIGGAAMLLMSRMAAWIANIIVWLPSLYSDLIEPGLINGSKMLQELANRISPEVYDIVNSALPNIISSIGSTVTNASMRLVSSLSGWAAKVPSRLLSTLICVIATIFMSLDYPKMTDFILRQFPERPRHILQESKERLSAILWKYGRSYGLILLITFAEVLIGLLIMKQKSAVGIAAFVAIVDIFPIVGTGTVLIPWGIMTLLSGTIGKGIGILVLWCAITVIRQVIEPRIVGKQVGLHPIITLIAMFVGSKLFGVVGLFGLPILCAILQSLDDAGVIHIFRHEEDPAPVATKPEQNEPS